MVKGRSVLSMPTPTVAPNVAPPPAVILGLEPRIQVADEAVDGRVKPDHDGGEVGDIAERAAVSAALFRYRYICLIVSSASISSRDPQTAICPRTSK